MTKILLSTVVYPLPFTDPYNDSWTDGTAQRFSRNQDMFTLRGHAHCVGPELIAQNISAPTVFLEYPTWEIFEDEVKKGYDYVGISFFPHHMEHALKMCEIVKRISPTSKTVLGGYGAMGVPEAFPEDEGRKKTVDYVCFGDGVKFFRQLLGDPVDAPIEQRLMPTCGSALPWVEPHPRGEMGVVIAGLGCSVGCDFCSTTVHHGGQRIQFADPPKIFEEMKRYWRVHPQMRQVMVYDEDFMKFRDQVIELGELIQNDTEFGLRKMSYFTLGSIESLSQFTWDELAMSGLGNIFIGVESKFAVEKGYEKRRGRTAEEVFENLNRIGISTLTGWVCGFDFHDKQNVMEDLNFLVSLEPTGSQLTRLSPFPGTVMHDKMKEEGRIYPNTTWKDYTFYGDEGGIIHKNFKPHEINEIIDFGYTKLYETWGPMLMREFKVHLNGYEYCRSSKHKVLREQKAEHHMNYCDGLYVMSPACEYFAPNNRVRARINRLQYRYKEIFGKPTRSQEGLSQYILLKAIAEKAKDGVRPRARKPKMEPPKKYIFEGNTKQLGENEIPYRVEYPRKSIGYELHSMARPVKEFAFGSLFKLLDLIPQAEGRKVDQAIMSRRFGSI